MKNVSLYNGVELPLIGYGTWQIPDGDIVRQGVLDALSVGYRSIDTAAAYENEGGVGDALKNCGLSRSDYFVTTKIWNSEHGYDKTLKAFDASMKRLQLDVLDLMLIHWPMPMRNLYKETWRALEEIYAQKRVRAIGVSNFTKKHLGDLCDSAKVIPMVNQIELHPYYIRTDLLDFCKQNKILVEAWSPLMQGGEALKDAVIVKIAQKHNHTAAQVILRYLTQLGARILPKSVHKERMAENLQIFDFELDADDMAAMASLNCDKRIGPDPDVFDMM